MRKKILIVAMGNSIHTIRWVSALAKQDYDVHVFNSFTIPNANYCEKYPTGVSLYNFEVNSRKYIKQCLRHPIKGIKALRHFSIDNLIGAFSDDIRSEDIKRLAKLINENDFAIVHTLHTQTSAALYLEAMNLVNKDWPVWINTVWGSDLYLHQWIPESRKMLNRILPKIDFYWGEGYRDYELARSMGFVGEFLTPVPAFGGFDIEQLERLESVEPSKRKKILVKGYMNVVGRAENAFHALERCVDLLSDYEIVIFSYDSAIILTIGSIFSNKYGIPVVSIAGISYEEILKLHMSARISIMLSTSDGLPASFAESMACGDFPIHSNSAMCDEWIEDGKTALIVDPGDVNDIAIAIRRALIDDELVDRAAVENRETIKKRMDINVINEQMARAYEEVLTKK